MPTPTDCSHFELPLKTARLQMQPLNLANFDAIFALCVHPDTCRYIRPAMTHEQVTDHIKDRQRPWAFDDGKWISMEVCCLGQDRVIGEVVFRMESRDDRRAEIGYRFHPDVWGKGYAIEAMHALTAMLIDKLDLHKLIAYCDPGNKASTRLLERLGMQQEGCYREHYFVFDTWSDSAIFGLLSRDYKPQDARV